MDKLQIKLEGKMNFECKKCGKCCSNFLPLSKREIQELRKLATRENKRLLEKDWYSTCPFLNYQNKCDIYENRPAICKGYTCYKFENHIFDKKFLKETKEKNTDFKLVDLREEIFRK